MTSNSIGLTDLNDECLFKLFKYCSIESLVALAECCSQFRRIIKSKNYENIRDYECEIWVRENEEQFRAELINHGKIFQNIGQYVRSLTIWINSEELPDEDLKSKVEKEIYFIFQLKMAGPTDSNAIILKFQYDEMLTS